MVLFPWLIDDSIKQYRYKKILGGGAHEFPLSTGNPGQGMVCAALGPADCPYGCMNMLGCMECVLKALFVSNRSTLLAATLPQCGGPSSAA